jgi:hypothetical protein
VIIYQTAELKKRNAIFRELRKSEQNIIAKLEAVVGVLYQLNKFLTVEALLFAIKRKLHWF